MLHLKPFAAGVIAAGFVLSSLGAAAATPQQQQILRAGANCNQEKQFRFFLQQLAATDGNPKGLPYAAATELQECAVSESAAGAVRDAAAGQPAAVAANLATTKY